MIKWLISDFTLRFFVAAIIGLTILAVAGFIEAGTIQWSSVLRRCVPYGACFGSMWTILRWRRLSADIIVSNRGEPPILYYSILLCVASVLCLSSTSTDQSIQHTEVPSVLGQTLKYGATVFEWSNRQVTRQHPDTEMTTFIGFPKPPLVMAKKPSHLALRKAIWPLCILALLAVLCLPRQKPSASFGLFVSTLCSAGGEMALRVI